MDPTIGRFNTGIGSCLVWRITHCNKSSNTVGKFRIVFAAALFLEYLQNGLESVKTSPRMNWFLLI